MDKKIQVKNIAQLSGHRAAVFALAEGTGAHSFFSGAGEGWLVEWDLRDPEIGKLRAKIEGRVFSLCYSQDQHWLVAGNMNGGVHWISLQDPEATKNILHHQKGVFAINVVQEQLYTIGGEGVITGWSVKEKRTMESLQLSNHALRCMDYCPSRDEIAVGASDHHIYILDRRSLSLKKYLPHAHDNSVFALHYSPEGKYLISGGRDAQLKIWNVEKDFQLLSSQPAHWYTINSIAFHPKEAIFATASRDKTIKIWDAENFQLLKVIEAVRDKGHVNSVNKLIWTKFRHQLISASDDRSIRVWEVVI